MDSLDYLDDLVREYLLFRGFHGTLRSFEAELKGDKLAGLDADRLTQVLLSSARNLDYAALQDTWSYLEAHAFPSLGSAAQLANVRRMETSLFRYFIVCAIQQNRPAKVVEFFESIDLAHSAADWMTWTSITFVKKPHQTPPFEVYFTKMWYDLFVTSLRNFLALAFASMPLPRLLNFNVERIKRKSLELEVSKLRETVEYWRTHAQKSIDASMHSLAVNAANSSATAGGGGIDDDPFIVLDEELVVDASAPATPRTAVAVTKDGQWVAAVGRNEATVRYWNVARPLATLSVPAMAAGVGPVVGLAWADKALAVAFPGVVQLFHVETKVVREAPLPAGMAAAACSSVAGATLWVAGPAAVAAVNVKTGNVDAHGRFPNPTASKPVLVHRSAQGKFVVVCTATHVAIFESATLHVVQVLTAPFAPAACYSLTDAHISLISNRGNVATFVSATGVLDPLQALTLAPFPTNVAPAACTVVSAAAVGADDDSSSSNTAAASAYLLAGSAVFALPAGKLVQTLDPAPAAPPAMVHGRGAVRMLVGGSGSGSGSRPGSVASVVAGSGSGSGGGGGSAPVVTSVAWAGNVIAQGLESGAVRVVKLMMV
ncbi:WD repeat-containing protein 91 [Allomyces arbusculus]|nr:WD repeat-containing protein 91 [Allomyces arbusculus]